MNKEAYLGDGVYIAFDGLDLCAYCDRIGERHYIHFERDMLETMLKYYDKWTQELEEQFAMSIPPFGKDKVEDDGI